MPILAGCATTQTSNTERTAMEQLLISNAVDRSLNRVDFTPLDGQSVFLDSTLIDCVDKNYIVASTRDRILQAGARLVEKKEASNIVVELRSGGVGTDQTEMFVGTPKMAVPGPFPVSIPEVKLWSRSEQTGTAKLGLVAYETESREIVGSGGSILARSDDSKSYFFGVGPWQSGTVRSEVRRQLGRPGWHPLPNTIAFTLPDQQAGEPSRLQLAGAATEETPPGDKDTASTSIPEATAEAGKSRVSSDAPAAQAN